MDFLKQSRHRQNIVARYTQGPGCGKKITRAVQKAENYIEIKIIIGKIVPLRPMSALTSALIFQVRYDFDFKERRKAQSSLRGGLIVYWRPVENKFLYLTPILFFFLWGFFLTCKTDTLRSTWSTHAYLSFCAHCKEKQNIAKLKERKQYRTIIMEQTTYYSTTNLHKRQTNKYLNK